MKNYTNIDELPACLTVPEMAAYMRISEPIAYQLVHRKDFPAVRVGNRRYIVPKDRLLEWMSRPESAV